MSVLSLYSIPLHSSHDLELLRIPLEKHEIPADIKLTELTGTEQSENLIGITNPKL
jgi:hypothetical protein